MTNMHTDADGRLHFDGGKPTLCELCGTVIGEYVGEDPHDNPMIVLRCFQCAATEEAEAITREAAA